MGFIGWVGSGLGRGGLGYVGFGWVGREGVRLLWLLVWGGAVIVVFVRALGAFAGAKPHVLVLRTTLYVCVRGVLPCQKWISFQADPPPQKKYFLNSPP